METIEVTPGSYTCEINHEIILVKKCILWGCHNLFKDGIQVFKKTDTQIEKKNADEYILRCFKEGKFSVDYENGEIFSTYLNRNFKQMKTWAGHHYLDFRFLGERRSVLVHRVVYLAKHGNIPEGHVIDHIDRNKSNNGIRNLRAVTHSENMKNIDRKK